ncbi:MAG: cytochrome c [Chromatiales bacterium]|nr:cytochrome c [Chromatiales bacterium]
MRWFAVVLLPLVMMPLSSQIRATDDERKWVALPERMQEHMLANMRDHLLAIHEILVLMADQDQEGAAEIAENRLGMTSLKSHGAKHMAGFMPEGMRAAGTTMHRAASRFSLTAQEGDVPHSYAALAEVTAACVACHAAYRIR